MDTYKKAIDAIRELHADQSVPIEDVLGAMEYVQLLAEELVEALRADVQMGKS